MHRQRRASIDLVHRFIGAEEDDAAAAKPSAPSGQALPTAWGDSAPAAPSKSASVPADDPPVVLGRMRIALGLLLFYINVYTDFLVLSVFRESEPLPVGEPTAPRLWGNLVVANFVLQSMAGYWNGSDGKGGGRCNGLLGALFLLPLVEAWQGAGRGAGRDGTRLARAKYIELWLENVPQGALQLFTLFAFGRRWGGAEQGNTVLASAFFSMLSGAFTMACHHELFDTSTFGAGAVDNTPVLGRFGLFLFTSLDTLIHTLMLAALGTAFRGKAFGFIILGMLVRMVLFHRIERETPKEAQWGGGGMGSVICALAFSLPMSVLDLLISERFGTRPLRMLMAYSFVETMCFSSVVCVASENLTPRWWGCSCKSEENDAVYNGLDYCFPEAGDFLSRIQGPAKTYFLLIVFAALWFIKVVAFFFLSMCARHASKVYLFE